MIETLTLDDILLMGKGTWQVYQREIKKYGPSIMLVVACVGVYALYRYAKDDQFFALSGLNRESFEFDPQGLPSELKFNEKERHCSLLHSKMITNSHQLNFARSRAEYGQLKREIDMMAKQKIKQNCKN